jgi:protein-S-isoprenylcysteine O-methyltransferase Ste14
MKKSWLQTRDVVENGIHVLFRHPTYVSFMSYVISLILPVLVAILGVLIVVLLYFFMRAEEQSSIWRFGKSWKQYMQKVPRLNLLMEVVRALPRSID